MIHEYLQTPYRRYVLHHKDGFLGSEERHQALLDGAQATHEEAMQITRLEPMGTGRRWTIVQLMRGGCETVKIRIKQAGCNLCGGYAEFECDLCDGPCCEEHVVEIGPEKHLCWECRERVRMMAPE